MNSGKFKVGDKVRITHQQTSWANEVSEVASIEHNGYVIRLKDSFDGFVYLIFTEDELELIYTIEGFEV